MNINWNDVLIRLDQVCDFVPFLSTLTNAINALIRRILFTDDSRKEELISNNHYYKHLDAKSSIGNVVYIPIVGNVALVYHRFHKKPDLIPQPLVLPLEVEAIQVNDEDREYEAKVDIFLDDLFTLNRKIETQIEKVKRRIINEGVFNVFDLAPWGGGGKSYTIPSLPASIGGLTRLTELNLRGNPISTLPAEIGHLSSLKILNLHHCQTEDFPMELWTLASLETLDLSFTKIKELPVEMGNLVNLKSLDLDDTEIESLPNEIGNLQLLTRLSLACCRNLESLPSEFANLVNLEYLDLDKTRLKSWPEELNGCLSLKNLNLSFIPLQKLPQAIENMVLLEELHLCGTRINSIPETIEKLTNLKILDLSFTEIDHIPEVIFSFSALEKLNIANTPIAILPPKISQLTTLKSLDINKTKIISVPSEIEKLSKLAEISIYETYPQIILPIEIAGLSGMRNNCFFRDHIDEIRFNAFKTACCRLLMIKNSQELDLSEIEDNKVSFENNLKENFCTMAVNSLCASEYIWSEQGMLAVSHIDHQDISGLKKEFEEYQTEFERYGVADKSILIEGKEIPCHGAIVPEYLIAEIQDDPTVTSKGVKAILFGLYCGFDENSVLLKHWKKDWLDIVLKLHPEVGENPRDFFVFSIEKQLEARCSLMEVKGSLDLGIETEGECIKVNTDILNNYCGSRGHNFISSKLSGRFKTTGTIDLNVLPLNARGVKLFLLIAYGLGTKSIVKTFALDLKNVITYIFPTNDEKVFAEIQQRI